MAGNLDRSDRVLSLGSLGYVSTLQSETTMKTVSLIIEESELGAGMAMMIGFGYMVEAVMMCYTPGLWCIYFKEVV